MGISALSTAAHAEETATTPAQVTADYRPVNALKRMGEVLRGLQSFTIQTQTVTEKVMVNGQKIQVGGTMLLEYQKPDHLRAILQRSGKELNFYYDGQQASLFTPKKGYYASVPVTGTVGEVLTSIEKKHGVSLPLTDLFIWGTPKGDEVKFESAVYVGRDYVDGVLCDQYAYRQGYVDWQIWLEASTQMLPRKLSLTNTADPAMPQHTEILNWDLKPDFSKGHFSFKAPANAMAIPLRERTAQ
ncbi:DUF2092 domain-containing protein [Chitinibacter sp. S2-10]|uniref:DUF2092 domain-containing protein n=1 Tax=Chitinibacter sp. S2-10 TaxID=3373597 RepID=UPI0039775F81